MDACLAVGVCTVTGDSGPDGAVIAPVYAVSGSRTTHRDGDRLVGRVGHPCGDKRRGGGIPYGDGNSPCVGACVVFFKYCGGSYVQIVAVCRGRVCRTERECPAVHDKLRVADRVAQRLFANVGTERHDGQRP